MLAVLLAVFCCRAASSHGDVSFVQVSALTHKPEHKLCDMFPGLKSWFYDEGVGILSPNYKRESSVASTPLFPDFDGDFKLEYFYSNHARSHTPTPNEGMVFGRIEKQDSFSSLNVSLTRIDKLPVQGRSHVDMHGSAILDLDRDGHLDMVVVTGLIDRCLGDASLLYWGSKPTGRSMWDATGGIETALHAGLVVDNGQNRGRATYVADFNNDGLLDILISNLEWEIHVPSRIFYNKGNRKFAMDPYFEEYINNKIVVGSSLIIQRDYCMDKGKSYSHLRKQFCHRKADFSWVNYTFDKSKGHMVGTEIEGFGKEHYRNIQAAWIDGDDQPDFFVSSCSPKFFYSSGEQEDLTVPHGFACETSIMQDFNLDGELEILSIYSQTGTHEMRAVLYTKDPVATKPPFWIVKDSVLDWPKRWNEYEELIEDIASVDYNNDGLMDVVFQDDALYHLTNTLWSRGQKSSTCKKPRFITVVVEGRKFNQYGIGSIISLQVVRSGPHHEEETRLLRRAVSSYSHGTSKKGGAADPRIIFGLGWDWLPQSIEVTWPGGEKSKVDSEKILLNHLDDVTNPLIVRL